MWAISLITSTCIVLIMRFLFNMDLTFGDVFLVFTFVKICFIERKIYDNK